MAEAAHSNWTVIQIRLQTQGIYHHFIRKIKSSHQVKCELRPRQTTKTCLHFFQPLFSPLQLDSSTSFQTSYGPPFPASFHMIWILSTTTSIGDLSTSFNFLSISSSACLQTFVAFDFQPLSEYWPRVRCGLNDFPDDLLDAWLVWIKFEADWDWDLFIVDTVEASCPSVNLIVEGELSDWLLLFPSILASESDRSIDTLCLNLK